MITESEVLSTLSPAKLALVEQAIDDDGGDPKKYEKRDESEESTDRNENGWGMNDDTLDIVDLKENQDEIENDCEDIIDLNRNGEDIENGHEENLDFHKNEEEIDVKSEEIVDWNADLEETEDEHDEIVDSDEYEHEHETDEESEEILNWDEHEEPSQHFKQTESDEGAETYEDKKIAAKMQLINEIRMANAMKVRELQRIADERREAERMERERQEINRPSSAGRLMGRDAVVGSVDDADSSGLSSSDEGSISVLSTIKEEESKKEEENNSNTRKAQVALALEELDMKLSDIQVMQAILLAEKASFNGETEFKTSDRSLTDLNNVEITADMTQDERGMKKFKIKAQNFFSRIATSVKVTKERAAERIRASLAKERAAMKMRDMKIKRLAAQKNSLQGE